MPMLVANLKSGYSVDYGMLMLGVLICTLPTANHLPLPAEELCQRHHGCSQVMDARTYCLTPAEWRHAKGCLTLAKRLGLIGDDTPAALEKPPGGQKTRRKYPAAEAGRRAGIRHTALFRPGLPAI